MKYNFDAVHDRRSSDSVKWRAYDEDVLPLWVADMDFVVPEPVTRALRQRIEHGIFGYGHEQKEFCDVLVRLMSERYQWKIQPEDIVFIPGVVVGFDTACHLAAKPGGGVLMQTPVYPPFLGAPAHAKMQRQEMALTCQKDGSYAIDFAAFEAAFTPQTSMFLLCNPHNPVGRAFRKDELEKMAEICLKHGALICSDEIHCDLIFSPHRHIPIASLSPEIARHTVTLIAPSKTYNIPGLNCSVAIIQDAELRQRFQEARQGLVGDVNILGMIAGLAAYRDGQEWLDQALTYLQANRDFLYDYVKQNFPAIQMAKPEATYLAWLDCRAAGLGESPYEFFLKNARVALNEGKRFGKGGEGFVRLNFGCAHSTLLAALEQMKKALLAVK